jgi:hypothetical protein
MRFSFTRLLMLMEELTETSSAGSEEKKIPKGGPGIAFSTDGDDDKDENE